MSLKILLFMCLPCQSSLNLFLHLARENIGRIQRKNSNKLHFIVLQMWRQYPDIFSCCYRQQSKSLINRPKSSTLFSPLTLFYFNLSHSRLNQRHFTTVDERTNLLTSWSFLIIIIIIVLIFNKFASFTELNYKLHWHQNVN